MNNLKLSAIIVLLQGVLLLPLLSTAQIVNGSAYIKATSIEVGIDGEYGYEGVDTGISPPLSGMHYRSNTDFFGYVANPQVNNWATFNGDFFTPGTPENGWGFEIGASTTPINAHNNCYRDKEIPGAITKWEHISNCYSVDWDGDYVNGTALHFKVNYFAQESDLFYTTTVSITNKTGSTINDLYYYRNVDPDNNQSIGGTYTTTNQIISQPNTGSCKLAHVKATQSSPWASYLGFAGIGNEFRVYKGGFSNRDASTMWSTGQSAGSTNTADEAIAIVYKIASIPPGQTVSFRYVVILDNAAAAAAINNLMYLSYPGWSIRPPAYCTVFTDTVSTCGGSVPINVTGPTLSDFTWNWSPATGLSSTVGPSVTANPSSNTTYTVTGTPLNSCYAPISLTVAVKVTADIGVNPVINSATPVCPNVSPFNLTANIAGGTWAGVGITSAANGTFNPNNAGPGTHEVIYALNGACYKADTGYVTVIAPLNPYITPMHRICLSSAPVTLTAASAGGTWSGPGITNSSTGVFNPAVAGTGVKIISYTQTSPCFAMDTLRINVVSPNPTINQPSSRCVTGSNFTLTAATSGGTWSGTGIINPSSGFFSPSTAGVGNHIITYTILSPCTLIDTVVVKITAPPNSTINQPARVCTSSGIQTFTAATTGGSWSGYGITSSSAGTFNPAVTGAGTFLITYTINSPCFSRDTAYITVVNPNPTITQPAKICNTASPISLTAVTVGGQWSGPGITNAVSGVFNPSVAGVGQHVITYTISSPCTVMDTVKINVVSPDATINPVDSLCNLPNPITLSAVSLGGSWSGTGITNSLTGIFTPSVAGVGIHKVVYTINSPCVVRDTLEIKVFAPPSSEINPVTPVCYLSSAFDFTSVTAGGTWAGTGITNTANGTFDPMTAGVGNHLITYSLSSPCAVSDTFTINVFAPPALTINQPDSICAISTPVTLSVNLTGGTWSGVGITNAATGVFDPGAAGVGTHIITYSLTNPCIINDTVMVEVFPTPDPSILNPDILCEGNSIYTLSAITQGGIWTGTGVTDSLTGTFNPSASGLYPVVYTITTNSCSISASDTVEVLKYADASIVTPSGICINSTTPLQLSAVNSGGTWSGTGISDTLNGIFEPSATGVGMFPVTYTINGVCPDSKTDLVRVYPSPVPGITADLYSGCAPLCVQLIETPAYRSAFYQYGDGDSSATGGVHCYTVPGTYTVTLTVSDTNNCYGTRSFDQLITVYGNPVAEFSISPQTAVVNDTVFFSSLSSPNVIYNWSFGEPGNSDNQSNQMNPTHFYREVGQYCILLEVTNTEGCTDTTQHCIEVLEDFLIEIPNIFTPNNDGINDTFIANGKGISSFKSIIFNRWGNVMAEWEGIDKGWDGTTKSGEKASDGVYYFNIILQTRRGDVREYKGWLQLMR